jgi:hypothetical protein
LLILIVKRSCLNWQQVGALILLIQRSQIHSVHMYWVTQTGMVLSHRLSGIASYQKARNDTFPRSRACIESGDMLSLIFATYIWHILPQCPTEGSMPYTEGAAYSCQVYDPSTAGSKPIICDTVDKAGIHRQDCHF